MHIVFNKQQKVNREFSGRISALCSFIWQMKLPEVISMRIRLRRICCAFLSVCLLWLSLPAGAEKTDLKTLQSRLLALGYEIGAADGILGEKTTAAILLAQRILADHGFGVSPTGTPDAKTAELILQEENSAVLRTLQEGSWGSRVREAQQKLIQLNLLRDSADGRYGANTKAAVAAFEAQMTVPTPDGIVPDGKLSADEYALLMSDLSRYGYDLVIAAIGVDQGHNVVHGIKISQQLSVFTVTIFLSHKSLPLFF